jgi:hypothetical protein
VRTGWPESYHALLEQAEPWEAWPIHWSWSLGHWTWPEFLFRYFRHLEPWRAQLLWSAIEAASRIRAIAMEAFHRGVSVQWFEFDVSAPSGGIPGLLLPLNARRIARVRPLVGPLLTWLALTVSNKESLVFWCPPGDNYAGILFTADSDLARISLPAHVEGAIATAPHHGSEANAKAYQLVADAATSVTWVRSDGRSRSRPGPTYLSLTPPRFCTLCRASGSVSAPKQAVHLTAQARVWTPQATRPCRCI